jgi:ribosome-binding protein aMBF1 (putative translation factor)
MELQQYRSLDQSFAANFPALENIADIPTSLIEARIVLGWSQGELGERLKLHSQQINRYEQCRYDSIGLSKAIQVGTVLQQELMRRNDWLNRYENQPHESGKNLTPVGLALTEGTVDRGN